MSHQSLNSCESSRLMRGLINGDRNCTVQVFSSELCITQCMSLDVSVCRAMRIFEDICRAMRIFEDTRQLGGSGRRVHFDSDRLRHSVLLLIAPGFFVWLD